MDWLHNLDSLAPDLGVSSRDTMVWPGAEDQYFDLGKRALDLILLSADLCEKPHYPSILDLPCGHGRVLRWLRAKYDYANIVACDLDTDAVDFCEQQFQAKPVYSRQNLSELPFKSEFDLIWCGSLLTHLPPARWSETIDCFMHWLHDCGVLVFSTHGRLFADQMASGKADFASNVNTEALLATYHRSGAAFEPYLEDASGSYGLSIARPSHVIGLFETRRDAVVRAYLERAWGVQDIVIVYKLPEVAVAGSRGSIA